MLVNCVLILRMFTITARAFIPLHYYSQFLRVYLIYTNSFEICSIYEIGFDKNREPSMLLYKSPNKKSRLLKSKMNV